MAKVHIFLALSLALLLLSRPALRLASAQEEDELEGDVPEDFSGDDDAAEDFNGDDFPEGDDYAEEGFGEGGGFGGEDEEGEIPDGDDGDVKALDPDLLAEKVAEGKPFLLEFYAPWCGHCKALAPEYKAAAEALKEHDVLLAKIDATKHEQTAVEYGVEGYPSLLWITGKVIKQYNGGRSKEDLVGWVKKRIGFAVVTLSTVDDAKKTLEENKALVGAYFKDLKGTEAAAYAESAKEADGIDYFQTADVAVAKALGVPTSKAAGIAVIKDADDRFTLFDGPYAPDNVTQFVMANRLPLFVAFSDDAASLIFGGSIKKMVFLFFPEDQYAVKTKELAPIAREYKGKLIFIYINSTDDGMDNVREFFGVKADANKALGFSTEKKDDGEKFGMDGPLTAKSLKAFASDLIAGTAKPFFKSEPKPEKNDGPVTVVVGDNFEEIVLDAKKDVLLEIYAPWCGHCKALEPTYTKLGEKFQGIKSVVIAKMDGTANEYPGVTIEGFPTLLFYPAANKTEPLSVDSERKLIALADYIKSHASIPFESPEIKEEEQPEVPEEGGEGEEEEFGSGEEDDLEEEVAEEEESVKEEL